MYLSSLALNQRLRQVRRDLSNPYEMHRTLSWAFAAGPAERPSHFLWRVEPTRAGIPPLTLVQSELRPRWDELDERFVGYLTEVGVKAYGIPDRLRAGQTLRFRLKANPTVTRDGKRRGLRSHEDQLAWLRRQGDRHGFSVLGCIVSSPGFLRARQERGAGQVITVQVVTYDGHLRVDDPARLRAAIVAGLGHAKALGLGLVSVAPIE